MELTITRQNKPISIHVILIPLAILVGWLILKNTAPDRVPEEVYTAIERGIEYEAPEPGDPGKWKFKDFKDPRKWWKQMKKRNFPKERITRMFKQGKAKDYAHPEKGPQGLKILEDPATGDYIIYEPSPTVNTVWQIAPGSFMH